MSFIATHKFIAIISVAHLIYFVDRVLTFEPDKFTDNSTNPHTCDRNTTWGMNTPLQFPCVLPTSQSRTRYHRQQDVTTKLGVFGLSCLT